MQRRKFFLRTTALTATMLVGVNNSFAQTAVACVPPAPAPAPVPAPVPAPTPAPSINGINAVSEIKALRIPTGAYAGAYEISPNGLSNWYFTNLGLISIVQYLDAADLDKYIRSYLDLYISKLEPNMSIKDVNFPFGRANTSSFSLVLADSDDSYAATTLTLATRYLRASQNWAWWDKNKTRLKDIAYRNIALAIKPNNLSSVFQAPRNQTNNAGYLMDNSEVYRGLKDFSAMLKERGDVADAAYYDSFAKSIGTAMTTLFVTASSGFRMADLSTATETSFYPGTSCQVFPQVFGVTECAPYFDRAWNFLAVNSPGWEGGKLDPYPFAVLGLAAAKRGLTSAARAQQLSIEKTFIANRPMVSINELGFYQRTKSVLEGRNDV